MTGVIANVVQNGVRGELLATHVDEVYPVLQKYPDRFFGLLIAHGFAGRTRAFADHHRYSRDDVAFAGAPAILMTQKDAVKCRAFADARMWMLPIRAHVDPALVDLVVEKLDGSQVARDAGVSRHQGSADPRS